MHRIKTLSLPLLTTLFGLAVVPADAFVVLQLTSEKTYVQDRNSVDFRTGKFNVDFADGTAIIIRNCTNTEYVPPGAGSGACSPGTTGFLSLGTLNGATISEPYMLVTSIIPAVVVEPRRPELAAMVAAPASKMPRPLRNFKDGSAMVFYNLHQYDSVREYVVTRYSSSRNYSAKQGKKFNDELVPGVYRYSFPRLNRPNLPAYVSAVVRPMVEGNAKMNNKKTGFSYTRVHENKWWGGFAQLGCHRPNRFAWKGLTRSTVITSTDRLYFSIKVMKDPKNPKSTADLINNKTGPSNGFMQSIFPPYATSASAEPRVMLSTPLNSSLLVPPVLASGTRGLAEVKLERNLKTGGVSYDFSSRRFHIPVIVVDYYTEFVANTFERGANPYILSDADGDGVNNLNEWILDSNAMDAEDIPVEPVAELHPAGTDEIIDDEDFRDPYFGFTVNVKLQTVPAVKYTIQRSIDDGVTWTNFVGDSDWSVTTLRLAQGVDSYNESTPERVEIRVESLWAANGGFGAPVQPPNTEGHRFRVKISL